MSFSMLLSPTAYLMPVSTECAAALLSFRYPSIYSKMVSSFTRYEKFLSRNAQSSFNSLPAVHFHRRVQPG